MEDFSKPQATERFVSIEIDKFFEVLNYLNTNSLNENLVQYLKSKNCNSIIIETKAVIALKKFILNQTDIDAHTLTSARDWCPCVTSAQ